MKINNNKTKVMLEGFRGVGLMTAFFRVDFRVLIFMDDSFADYPVSVFRSK